ncbi:hypothetical protein LARI1_G004678 [Lachnellula arida]|uniref:Mating-type switching protein swi10 n=1 Tax=Lachnellula arida TaxID=1316785 RepID=A0A8T9B842_9HELO|nr:hypothetical protein LARI1_G004678 [Lachnellula arida]
MAFLLYMLGMAHHPNSDVPTTAMHPNKERRRLQKPPRAFRPCRDIFDVVKAQSCLTLTENEYGADDALTDQGHSQLQKTGNTSEAALEYLPKNVLEAHPSNHSNEALSHYSGDEMDAGDCKRRRCKTPVLYVGQLESEPLEIEIDPAKCYADQYRAELPPRVYTPSIEPQLAKPRRRLRKIKSQLSLRDTIKAHARSNSSISSCETLVGLDSPQSPASTITISPTKGYFEIEKLHLVDKPYMRILPPDSQACADADAGVLPDPDDDIALQMCTTLLSNELATMLSKHHPEERQDRTSGLQILLMIEAYEAMQQQVRQDLYASQFTEQTCQLKGLDSILDHWIDTLYATYEQTQKIECEKIDVVEIEEEVEDWPLRRSVMSPAPYVNQRGWF